MSTIQKPQKRVMLPAWASGVIVAAAILATAALLWALADQNRQLKRAIAATVRSEDVTPTLAVGDRIPNVAIVDLSGNVEDILAPVSGGGVLAVFTTTCRFCMETLPRWSELHEQLAEAGVPFVGISLHDLQLTRDFVSSNALPWPVRVLPDLADARKLRITGVPFTVLVSPAGKVQGAWRGALGEREVETIYEGARSLCPSC